LLAIPLSGCVEFSHPIRAKVLLMYGNSSNPHSPHFGDQLRLAAKYQWREPWLTRGEIEKHLENRTAFHSDGSVGNPSVGKGTDASAAH
jgi:hypothetical protein